MKTLSNNWITEGLIDVEYKTYLLLAYLSEVKKDFDQQKLYPVLSDLVQHYENILSVKNGRARMREAFPRNLTRADWEHMRLEFSEQTEENDFFAVMDEIIEYTIPRMQAHLEEGKDLYQFVESHLHISPLGVAALANHDGFFFLLAPPGKSASVYQYHSTLMHMPNGPYRALHVSHVSDFALTYTNTLESIKLDLVKSHKSNTLPATYLIESEVLVPWQESLLPVAKRRLMEYLAHT